MDWRRLTTAGLIAALVLALALPAIAPASAAERKAASRSPAKGPSLRVYRWVDENGVTHYGDQVPPEYAATDRVILNSSGIEVGSEDRGPRTAEEVAAAQAAAARAHAEEQALRRDQVLLSTYLSVEEIEALRDRRMELIDGQVHITENYLTSLRDKLAELQDEAAAYRPYNPDPQAAPIDESLAEELSDTLESIALYERTLADTRTRQTQLRAQFETDILRFTELVSNR